MNDINDCKNSCYDEYHSYTTKIVYFCMILLWIFIIIFFNIMCLPYSYLLILPIIYFIFNIYNSDCLSEFVESEIIRVIYFPMLIIIGSNFYRWINEYYIKYEKYNKKISLCIFISFVSLLLSSIDLWVNKKHIFTARHIRSGLESITVFLLIYVIIIYAYVNNL